MDVNDKCEHELVSNLICVTHRCHQCKDIHGNTHKCNVCGNADSSRDFTFYSMDPFITHVLEQGPKFTQVVALAHNAHGFDSLFVAREILEQQQIVPEILASGHKIMQLTVNNIIFRDKFLFMSVRSADFPKTLGLDESLRKGDFPHLFNNARSQNYIGLYPDLDYYDLGSKSEKDAEAIAL